MLPPIPETVFSVLGPVPVKIVEKFEEADEDVEDYTFGKWCATERCIKLRAGMHEITTLVTLWHERLHVLLWDAGVGLSIADEERVCDALSAALVAELVATDAVSR